MGIFSFFANHEDSNSNLKSDDFTKERIRNEDTFTSYQNQKSEPNPPPLIPPANIFQFSDPRPVSDILKREAYSLAFDRRFRIPYWSAEILTKDSIWQRNGDRKLSRFVPDADLPEMYRAQLEDYKAIPRAYDRGHLCPASNAKVSQKAMNETHYLSNVAPQQPMFNQKYWRKLEDFARQLTKSYDYVIVYTGLLFLANEIKDGRTYCRFEILNNNLAVPTHWYKIFYAKRYNEPPHVAAFIMPNNPIDLKKPMTNFQAAIQNLEKASGLDFSSRLPKNFGDLCKHIDCSYSDWKDRYEKKPDN